MIIPIVLTGYLVLCFIVAGAALHFGMSEIEALLIALMWPFFLAAIPFYGIMILTKKVLDKLHKRD